MSNQMLEFDRCKITGSTKYCAFVTIANERQSVPWSQVDEGSISKDGDFGTFICTRWIAEKKGFDHHADR